MATAAQLKAAHNAPTKSEGMRQLLDGGMSIADVAKEFGVQYGFVYGVARRAAGNTAPAGATRRAAKAPAKTTKTARTGKATASKSKVAAAAAKTTKAPARKATAAATAKAKNRRTARA